MQLLLDFAAESDARDEVGRPPARSPQRPPLLSTPPACPPARPPPPGGRHGSVRGGGGGARCRGGGAAGGWGDGGRRNTGRERRRGMGSKAVRVNGRLVLPLSLSCANALPPGTHGPAGPVDAAAHRGAQRPAGCAAAAAGGRRECGGAEQLERGLYRGALRPHGAGGASGGERAQGHAQQGQEGGGWGRGLRGSRSTDRAHVLTVRLWERSCGPLGTISPCWLGLCHLATLRRTCPPPPRLSGRLGAAARRVARGPH